MVFSSTDLLRVDLVDQLHHLVRSRVDAATADAAERFLSELYRDLPPNDLVPERPQALLAAGLSLLEFATRRQGPEPQLRVFAGGAEVGFAAGDTVVEMVSDNLPFLVDSINNALEELPGRVRVLLHPILLVTRTESGELVDFRPSRFSSGDSDAPSSGETSSREREESIVQIRIADVPEEHREALASTLLGVLHDVRVAHVDFQAMRAHCVEQVAELGSLQEGDSLADEAARFLNWLCQDNFIYLGYSYCRFESAPLSSHPMGPDGVSKSPPPAPGVRFDRDRGLGLLRDPNRSMFDVFEPPRKREILSVLKTNRRSTVHRNVHLDAVIVSSFDVSERVVGAHMFVGLFTAQAYSTPARQIPLVSHKIQRALRRSGFSPHSHNGRSLRFLLETYPRDELFQISDSDLYDIGLGILHLGQWRRVGLFVRRDPFGRFVSCLVYVPRDRMDTTLRFKVQDILTEAFEGILSAYYPHIGDEPLARLHLIIKTPGPAPRNIDFAALERKLEAAARTWRERLERTLPAELGEAQAPLLAMRYGSAFPAVYREMFDEIVAVNDIEGLEEARESASGLSFRLASKPEVEQELSFRIYSSRGYLELSDVLPMLENLGLRVVSEASHQIQPRDATHPYFIHNFSLRLEGVAVGRAMTQEAEFVEVFSRAWQGQSEDDGFNQLVLFAGLSAREVVLLRAYAHYLQQIQVPFSQGYLQRTLRSNPEITRRLVAYFEARFCPERHNAQREHALKEDILASLDQVSSLDEDRILRLFVRVIGATLRTNFYQKDVAASAPPSSVAPELSVPSPVDPLGKNHLAFKLDPSAITGIPKPAPYREIFVTGPRTEGVHLRFGKVARGGLRWSDRPEDFRTEVLGLVKAQQVKNAVIVPVGSKGGFVVRRPPPADAGRDALREEGIACYRIFISCLLDLTDNRVRSESGELTTSAPPRTVCHDDPDPYLVVAADKGTATFSDIANEISRERGFWLDDAFASGGSAGYDHKRMGITARGAWESVKRHFRELGKDIQSEPFTCVGVGDMGGDVFGNGMLLSRQTRLLAAFDHRHIFLDPDPDPQLSFNERARLFALPRSSWDDYDRALISKGGGVYPRSLKQIPLSVEMRDWLGLDVEALTPAELITELLRAEVDLLWLGGIGTYAKASHETHGQVGDRANDSVRVDAAELGAKVVGEGANLGLTQRARVEYCLAGGRCNTDFIDNSGGVDSSDREVNIKIVLREVERRGELARAARNELLESMTQELAQLVLRSNYLQSQSISVTAQLGTHLTDRLARSMRRLEREARLDRALECLPDDETLVERQRVGLSFTRPELSVLVAYAKNSLAEELLREGLPELEMLNRDLIEYFPTALRQTYRSDLLSHQLRNELIVTLVTNDIVNRMGISFAHEVGEATGASAAYVAAAYVSAREVTGMRKVWGQIEALDNLVPAGVQAEMLVECARLLERITVWLLRQHNVNELEACVRRYRPGIEHIVQQMDRLLQESQLTQLRERACSWVEQGVPEELAFQVASSRQLISAVDVVRVSEQGEVPLAQAAALYFEVAQRFGFAWLYSATGQIAVQRSWDRQALVALKNDLFAALTELSLHLLSQGPALGVEPEREPLADAKRLIASWRGRHSGTVARLEQLLAELRASPELDFGMLVVAQRQLAALVRAVD